MSSEASATVADTKRMRLRYEGPCRECGVRIEAGTTALYHRASKTVSCLQCADGSPIATAPSNTPEAAADACPDAEPELTARLSVSEGSAGASARLEFERRHAAREHRVRERFPRAAGMLLAITDDPQSTRAWDVGARGEERLGGMLNRLAGPSLRVLHDRRVPGSRANIDHMVVSPSGVFVIDAKRYKGRPQLRVEGGLLRPRVERLTVGGRDCTKLVDGVIKQVQLVSAALDGDRVQGMMVFVDGDWPLIGGSFATRGVMVARPKRLARLLRGDGPYDEGYIERIQHRLAATFPPH